MFGVISQLNKKPTAVQTNPPVETAETVRPTAVQTNPPVETPNVTNQTISGKVQFSEQDVANLRPAPTNVAELLKPSATDITQGLAIDSISRNISESKQAMANQPQQPIIVNQGGGSGGQSRSKTQKTPSNESPMGIEVGARSNEPTLLKAQYNSVRPL